MKNICRLLIAAVLFTATGLWTILQYCNGTTGFNFGWPVDGSKLTIDLTTIGTAVWVGIPLIALGLLLLTAAFLGAIIAQFVPDHHSDYEESSSKRMITLGE